MSKLSDFKIDYEVLPTDDLLRKLKRFTQSAKLKATRKGWVAQVRPTIKGKRIELSEIAPDPQDALIKLDERLQREGLYD